MRVWPDDVTVRSKHAAPLYTYILSCVDSYYTITWGTEDSEIDSIS